MTDTLGLTLRMTETSVTTTNDHISQIFIEIFVDAGYVEYLDTTEYHRDVFGKINFL